MVIKSRLVYLLSLPCLLTINFSSLKTLANPTEITQIQEKKNEEFTVIPLGLIVNKRNVVPSTLIKGFEDGNQAIDFENWLLRFSDVVTALQLKIDQQNDGFWQITTPGLVTRINSAELVTDPELGLVISVKQIQTWLKVPMEFDLLEYAIAFNPPWSGIQNQNISTAEIPIITEGLTQVFPSPFTVTAIGNKINISGTNSDNITYQGELIATGTILDGGWFIRSQQSALLDSRTWKLQEAQWWYQGKSSDYIIGSQPTFWEGNSSGNYWGFTTIRHSGFEPIKNTSGGFDPRQRYQPNQVERTIRGRAAPGTLVQLVRGFGNQIIAEILVNESGKYAFKIPVKREKYQVKLYRDGLLIAKPEVRQVDFTDVPELLTNGTSVLTISTGLKREFEGQSFVGNFKEFVAGVVYRQGLSEDLTLGIGLIHDNESIQTLGEIFYQPKDIPFQLAISAMTPNFNSDWQVESRLLYRPTSDFSLNFNGTLLRQKLDFNWRISPNLNFIGTANQAKVDPYLGAALQFSYSKNNTSTYARAEINSNSRLIWSLSQSFGSLRFDYRQGKSDTQSEISYNLSGKSSLFDGHSLIFDYDITKQNNQQDYLAALGWRYRSESRLNDGFPLWEFNLGYSIGSRGQGVLASLGTGIIPGVSLKLGYQEVSLSSDTPQFRIELFPRLNLQNGIRTGPNSQDFERLRSEGGLWVKPFFDRNNNGKLDNSEDIFTKDANLLLILNNQPILFSRPEIKPDGIFVTVPPGIYRLDLDPAGFPLDWTPQVSAMAVKIASGSYTEVLIPFTLSYSVSGVVSNANGIGLNGVKVEAISTTNEETFFSVTNGGGIFYLEGLKQGTYNLKLNGQPADPSQLIIDQSSEPFQELNLQNKLIN